MVYKQKNIFIVCVAIIIIILLGVWWTAVPAAKITQYADVSGAQAMFYTIEIKTGELVVIDGGWASNEESVREILKEKGNRVSAWILTHPHPDHIGAFNEIYQDLGEIVVDKIYTIEMNYDLYKEYAKPWDDFSTYEDFLRVTANSNNVEYLHTGDELRIGLCKIEVYHAYDESLINYTTGLANGGSMVFEIYSNRESFLFCSDVLGEKLCNKIIEEYKDKLSATYLQMGHHGNNSITEEFYRVVNPKAAFFDAPEWLVTGEDYDTSENIDMVEKYGAIVYKYSTAPNEVFIR